MDMDWLCLGLKFGVLSFDFCSFYIFCCYCFVCLSVYVLLVVAEIEGWCLVGLWCLIVSISVVRSTAVESLSWWFYFGVCFSMFVLDLSWRRRSRISGGFGTIGTLKL